MIRARYRTDGRAHSLVLVGHADFDEHGNDIVCAGASAIVFSLLGWIENNGDDIEDLQYNVERGETWINCEGGDKTAAAFDMATIGLEQLMNQYPDHVFIDFDTHPPTQ